MIFHQSPSLKAAVVAAFIASTATTSVFAFDAKECDVYVFRTQENALWHCGAQLPAEPDNQWTHLYCDHSMNDQNAWPFAWASDHPDDWCDFMISTVRAGNEDHYPLTTNIDINDTPGPNKYFFSTLVDWGCYMVDDATATVTASYLVDSSNGNHASTTTDECVRTKNYFDYWNLNEQIRNVQWAGHVPDASK